MAEEVVEDAEPAEEDEEEVVVGLVRLEAKYCNKMNFTFLKNL